MIIFLKTSMNNFKQTIRGHREETGRHTYVRQQSQFAVTRDGVPVGFHKIPLCAPPFPLQLLL